MLCACTLAACLSAAADAPATPQPLDVDAQLERLASDDPDVMYEALFALGTLREPRPAAVAAVRRILPNEQVGWRAADLLAYWGRQGAEALIAASTDVDPAVRRRALPGLWKCSACPPGLQYQLLTVGLQDPDQSVAYELTVSLNLADQTHQQRILLAWLREASPAIRLMAARFLSKPFQSTKDAAMLSALVEALRDSDEKVQVAAAESLNPYPGAVIEWEPAAKARGTRIAEELMIAALTHPAWAVRRPLFLPAMSLTTGPARRAFLDLAVRDADSLVRDQAANWLQKMPDANFPAAFAGDLDANVRAVAATRVRDPDQLRVLLSDPDAGVRREAVRDFGELKNAAAFDDIAPLLQDSDDGVRYSAVAALSVIDDPRVIELFLRLLLRQDGQTTTFERVVIEYFGQRPDPRAVDPLIRLLHDLDLRRAAAEALGRMGDPRAGVALVEMLFHPHRFQCGVEESWMAAEALAHAHDPEAVRLLVEKLDDDAADHHWRAAYTLGLMKHPGSVEPLMREVAVQSVHATEAAHLLGDIGDTRAVPTLITALDDASYLSHDAVARALAPMHDDRAFMRLSRLASDANVQMRKLAAEALGGSVDIRAVQMLGQLAQGDPDVDVQQAAIGSLARLKNSEAIDVLIELSNMNTSLAQDAAARALAETNDPRALRHFVLLLLRDDDRDWVAQWLRWGKARPAAFEPLLALLRHSDCEVSGEAAFALGAFPDRRAVEPLIATLKALDARYNCSGAQWLMVLGLRGVTGQQFGRDVEPW